MNEEELIKRIHLLKRDKHLSKGQIAKKLEISLDYVSRIIDENSAAWKEEDLDIPTNSLNTKILQRFMSEEEMKKLWKTYKANTYKLGVNRETSLNSPLRLSELNILRDYVTDLKISINDLEVKHGLQKSTLFGKVVRYAIKVVAQNPEVLDKVKTSDETLVEL